MYYSGFRKINPGNKPTTIWFLGTWTLFILQFLQEFQLVRERSIISWGGRSFRGVMIFYQCWGGGGGFHDLFCHRGVMIFLTTLLGAKCFTCFVMHFIYKKPCFRKKKGGCHDFSEHSCGSGGNISEQRQGRGGGRDCFLRIAPWNSTPPIR